VVRTGKAGAGGAKASQPSFEEALAKLESIVEAMETEELPLESLLSQFEEGTKLARLCQSKLADAELKIQRLEQDADGAVSAAPATDLEAPAT